MCYDGAQTVTHGCDPNKLTSPRILMTNPATRPSRYREITVSGSPREMGRQIGEAVREKVQGFCEVALSRVHKTVSISHQRAMQIANACIPFAEKYSPQMIEELCGTAEASGVTLDELMLLQVRNQLQPDQEAGCTAISIAADATVDGLAIVAQNWDNDPLLDDFTVVLTRRPTDKPALMTVTQAGLISYLGLNDTGIGACVNTLPAPARDIGVPHYFILREMFETNSLDRAVHAARRAHRAIPVNVMLSTPQGPADLEITIDDIYVLRDEQSGYITHTNHCVHSSLQPVNNRFPELIQSHSRKQRIDALLDVDTAPFTIDDVQRLLSDHDGFPCSICRHANNQPLNGFWKSVFSLVMQPAAGRMYVSRGCPCSHPFEVYQLECAGQK